MSTIQNSDLFLVNRSGTSYKVTSEDVATYANNSSNTREFVAKGNIPNGSAVVVNDDGTVSVAPNPYDPVVGSKVQYEDHTNITWVETAFDPVNGKVIVLYCDNKDSGKGKAVVGTISGYSISFSSPVMFAPNGGAYHLSCTFDTNLNRVVVCYQDNSNSQKGTAVVGTVSGDTISFGSPVLFNPVRSAYLSMTFDTTNNKVVIVYANLFQDIQECVVGTVSGDSISFGSPFEFNDLAPKSYYGITFDSDEGKVVIAYVDGQDSYKGKIKIGTVSGNSISFTAASIFEDSVLNVRAVYDPVEKKSVIIYKRPQDESPGFALLATISDTSISFGTPVEFSGGGIEIGSVLYDTINEKVIIICKDTANNNNGTVIAGTVSDESIEFGTPTVWAESGVYFSFKSTYDSTNGKIFTVHLNDGYVMGYPPNSSKRYVGLAAEAISDGATGKITTVGGVNSSQTGLNPGRKYYGQEDGSIGLTKNPSSFVAGTSISSTEIIVRKS